MNQVPGLIQLPQQPAGGGALGSHSVDHGNKGGHRPVRETYLHGGGGGVHPPRHLEQRNANMSVDRRKMMTSQRTLFDPANPHKPIVVVR